MGGKGIWSYILWEQIKDVVQLFGEVRDIYIIKWKGHLVRNVLEKNDSIDKGKNEKVPLYFACRRSDTRNEIVWTRFEEIWK